jgi:hypothetical protein
MSGDLVSRNALPQARDTQCVFASSTADLIAVLDYQRFNEQILRVYEMDTFRLVASCDFYREFRGASLFALSDDGKIMMHNGAMIWESDPRDDFQSTILFSLDPNVRGGESE